MQCLEVVAVQREKCSQSEWWLRKDVVNNNERVKWYGRYSGGAMRLTPGPAAGRWCGLCIRYQVSLGGWGEPNALPLLCKPGNVVFR